MENRYDKELTYDVYWKNNIVAKYPVEHLAQYHIKEDLKNKPMIKIKLYIDKNSVFKYIIFINNIYAASFLYKENAVEFKNEYNPYPKIL